MGRRRVLVALLTALIVTGALSGPPPSADAQEDRADHPFSDPVWFPLRNPARVSCVKTNCIGPYHGYDAIDLVGERGDPIYAAGAGILHIGGVAPGCVTGTPTRGTWVWIDHGPAGQTRYHHLDTIVAEDGQFVTPGTLIATMGNSGDQVPCSVSYLHMEYRDAAVTATKLPIPSHFGCVASSQISLPQNFGFSDWDDVTPQTYFTPQLDNACLPSSWSSTPEKPSSVAPVPGVGSMEVGLPMPEAGVSDVRVRLELFHPSLGEYGAVTEASARPTDLSVEVGGLLENRLYRVSVSHKNASGWSAWSDPIAAETGFVPVIPEYRDSFSTATTISYKWFRGTNSDADYRLAIRRENGPAWGPWEYFSVPHTELSYRFRGLMPGVRYQVRVRAENDFGASGYTPARTLQTVCHTVCSPAPYYPTLQPADRLLLRD